VVCVCVCVCMQHVECVSEYSTHLHEAGDAVRIIYKCVCVYVCVCVCVCVYVYP